MDHFGRPWGEGEMARGYRHGGQGMWRASQEHTPQLPLPAPQAAKAAGRGGGSSGDPRATASTSTSGAGRWKQQPSWLPNWDLSLHLQSACGPELSGVARRIQMTDSSLLFSRVPPLLWCPAVSNGWPL